MGIRNNNVPVDLDDVPQGMKVFTVAHATIKDSTGSYREAGELCLLDKKDAMRYHKLQMIQVDLPDFDEDSEDGGNAGKKPAARAGAKAEAKSGEDNGQIKP